VVVGRNLAIEAKEMKGRCRKKGRVAGGFSSPFKSKVSCYLHLRPARRKRGEGRKKAAPSSKEGTPRCYHGRACRPRKKSGKGVTMTKKASSRDNFKVSFPEGINSAASFVEGGRNMVSAHRPSCQQTGKRPGPQATAYGRKGEGLVERLSCSSE